MVANLKLKASLIEVYGSQITAARALGINEYRLSRIIHGRARPCREEKRRIACKLQRKIDDLFPEGERL